MWAQVEYQKEGSKLVANSVNVSMPKAETKAASPAQAKKQRNEEGESSSKIRGKEIAVRSSFIPDKKRHCPFVLEGKEKEYAAAYFDS